MATLCKYLHGNTSEKAFGRCNLQWHKYRYGGNLLTSCATREGRARNRRTKPDLRSCNNKIRQTPGVRLAFNHPARLSFFPSHPDTQTAVSELTSRSRLFSATLEIECLFERQHPSLCCRGVTRATPVGSNSPCTRKFARRRQTA